MQLARKPPSPQFELRIPSFSDISGKPQERLLLDHFHNVLSHLIVLQEDDGNPFQRLVVPMAHRSEAVRSAILALSSAHKEFHNGRPDDGSLIYHNRTIRSLAKLIAQGSVVNRNELMATVILLIYYEVVSYPLGHMISLLCNLLTIPQVDAGRSFKLCCPPPEGCHCNYEREFNTARCN